MLKFKHEREFTETEIGGLPKGWEIAVLGDESKFTIIMGQSPPSKYYNQRGEGIPFIQGKKEFGDLYVETETYTKKCAKIAPPYSILVTVRAPVGELNITKGKLCIGRGVAAVLNKDRLPLQNKFIYYVLKGLNEYLSMLGERGTTYDSITKEELDNFVVPFPKSVERSRIATVLSWFDDLIENKKRQNEILEKTAMAIFKSWFIDFEPFKDEEFVNSEMGKIPKGWRIVKLGEVVDSQYGFTESAETEGEIKLLRIMDINKTLVIDWDRVPFCKIDNENFKKYRLGKGDIVISRIADIGKVAIVEDPPGSVFASYLIRLKIKPTSYLTPYYLYYWLKSSVYQDYILYAGSGSTRQNTNARVIKSGPMLIPRNEQVVKFSLFAESIRQKITINQKQIMVLRKIRDTLLPLLVFGRLRVEEI